MNAHKRTQDDLSKEFDVFSANYTEDMIKCVPYYLDLLNAFKLDYPPQFAPKTILDLGCGNGNVTSQLIEKYPKASYTLVDASQDMLDLCKKRFVDTNVNFVRSYFNDFNFFANSYDLVVGGFSLHHCHTADKKYLFIEIYKALAPGGIFGVSDLMISKEHEEHERVKSKWKTFVTGNYPNDEKWKWIMEHYAEYDNPDNLIEQTQWLIDLGFEIHHTVVKDKYWVHFKARKPHI